VAIVGAAFLLQGCGGGADTKTTGAPAATTTAAAATATTTTTVDPACVPEQGKLLNCLCRSDFVAGDCTALNVGACYKTGKAYMCWGDDKPTEDRTDAKCVEDGFEAACQIKGNVEEFDSVDKVPKCDDMPNYPSKCNPPQIFWGACYSGTESDWLCIGPEDTDAQSRYMKGACQTEARQDDPKVAYKGLCKLSDAPQKLYKCETVPTYKAGAQGTGNENDSACFTIKPNVGWAWSKQASLNQNCATERIDPEAKDTWTGACLLTGASGYDQAEKYPTGAAVEVV